MIEDNDTENLDAPNGPDSPSSSDFSNHDHPHPSADMDNNPAPCKTPRVTVEEAEDDDGTFSYTGHFFDPQADAGWALYEGETKFEGYKRDQEEGSEHPWSPFEDTEEWDLAQWLVKNLGQTRTDEFLKLPIVSFHNNHAFLQKVDGLPHGPEWSCRKVTVHGNLDDENGVPLQDEVELWSHDPVECVKELIGNPFFKEDMAYSPARAYADHAGQHRVIDEMWTADWWGETQKALPKGATIAPIILSSDKTCLSQFRGDKSAWPLDCFSSDAHSLAGYRLFHHCMVLLLHPLIAAGQNDSLVRHVYLMLAAYVADFPKQCLVACCKENCSDERGNGFESVMHDPESTKEILERRKNGQHPPEFEENGLHAVYKPFWADLPHANIFLAFTPDLLHQLHKGVFKDHLMRWCIDIVGEEEMDAQFKAIPDYSGLRHFKKGISTVKQWTGSEHKEMQRVFVGLLSGAVPSHVLAVARSILDFLYYARLQIHTTEMLDALQTALGVFHANKDVLTELAIREHFNIPKLHQLTHYVQSIMLFGAADGFNTELPERLHIDFAKDAYRASNKWDYEEQMALWLQQQEAVFLRGAYLDWISQQPQALLAGCTEHHSFDSDSDSDTDLEEVEAASSNTMTIHTGHTLAKAPAHPHQTVEKIVTAHGATDFLPTLQSFLRKNLPHINIIPGIQDHFDVYFGDTPKWWHVRARPEVVASGRKPGCPARFDMALISDGPCSLRLHTLDGVRVAQVRAIFTLPRQFGIYSRALAYIEWFTPFRQPDPSSRLQQVSRSTRQLRRNAAVIHVDEIMGQSVDVTLRRGNAHEVVNDFYFNEFIDSEMFSVSVINSRL
ncbi:hypothetical protein BDR05DRAFT_1032465 [Suillus weaverae]|nr:hypothetical protein BDR05DRAFT_1032465 [Suillus weaverae]